MPFAENQDMIQAVAPKCPDQALNIWILPWRSRGCRAVPNPHRPDSTYEGLPVGAIIVAPQVGRRRVPRECLHDLLCEPLRGRMPGHRKPEHLSTSVTDAV